MKSLVTGATGLLGSNIVKELQQRGFGITALARRQDAKKLLGPDIAIANGDLREVKSYDRHLHGIDVLIHAAACYSEFYRKADVKTLEDTNVTGTLNLFEAAKQKGIKTIIYVSSAAVLQPSDKGIASEKSPYNEHTADPYFSSKVAAEKAVLNFAQKNPDIKVVLILPTVMLGPGDSGPTPTGLFIMKLLRGELKFILPGWHRIVDARDVANAVCEAITKGKSGARYVIGGSRYSVAEIYREVTAASGIRTPEKAVSLGKLLMMSRIMQLISKITHKQPPLTPNMVKRLQEQYSYNSDKAIRELGISFRPFSVTMADTIKWFQAQ